MRLLKYFFKWLPENVAHIHDLHYFRLDSTAGHQFFSSVVTH